MNKFKLSLFFRYAINLVYALLFVFPLCKFRVPQISENWAIVYIYKYDFLIIFAPFGILWILFQVIKNKKVKKFAKWLSLILSTFYFLGSITFMFNRSTIIDYIPDIGNYLLLLLSPLIAFMIFFEKREREDIIEDYEDILDA